MLTPRRSPRTAPPSPVIARSVATWQSVLLLHRTSNLCVGAGFSPARSAAPSQLSPVGRHQCAPPMIAVPTTAGHIGPALQDFRRGRCPHRPVCTAPRKNTVIARSKATWQSVFPSRRVTSLCFRRAGRLPTVVPTDFHPLSWPPIGALPRNRLASSATGGASPISPSAYALRYRENGRGRAAAPTQFQKNPSSSPKTFRFQLSAFHVPHSPPNQQVFPYINRSHFSIPL